MSDGPSASDADMSDPPESLCAIVPDRGLTCLTTVASATLAVAAAVAFTRIRPLPGHVRLGIGILAATLPGASPRFGARPPLTALPTVAVVALGAGGRRFGFFTGVIVVGLLFLVSILISDRVCGPYAILGQANVLNSLAGFSPGLQMGSRHASTDAALPRIKPSPTGLVL